MTRINKTDVLFKEARKFPLNEKFLRFFRKDLADYVKVNPVLPAPRRFFLKKVFSFSAIPITAAVMLFIFLGGLVSALASPKSAPGDLLYPLKIAAEELRAVFIASGKPKADFRIKQAYTRINEIRDLQKKATENIVKTEEKKADLVKETTRQFNSHLEDAISQTQSLKEKNKLEEASAVNEKLAVSLKFYKKILEKEEIRELDRSAENDMNEDKKSSAINTIIRATEDFQAKTAEKQAEVKKQEAGDFQAKSEVEEKITLAAGDIKEIEELIQSGKMPEAVISKAENDLKKARSVLGEAGEKLARGDDDGAFAKAQDTLEITRKIRAFMETAIMIEQEKPDEASSQIKDILLDEKENQTDNKGEGKAEERDEKSGEKNENRGKN